MAVTGKGVFKALLVGGAAYAVATIAPLGALAVWGITAATAGTALVVDSADDALRSHGSKGRK